MNEDINEVRKDRNVDISGEDEADIADEELDEDVDRSTGE